MAQINKYKHSPFYGICLEDLHLNKRAQDMLDIQKTIMPYSIFGTLLENSKYGESLVYHGSFGKHFIGIDLPSPMMILTGKSYITLFKSLSPIANIDAINEFHNILADFVVQFVTEPKSEIISAVDTFVI